MLHRLKALVNSMLMIARLESHQYLREESVEICELIREVTGELEPIAEDGEVTVTLRCEINYTMKNANRSLLFSMLYNVVNNAVQHTPRWQDRHRLAGTAQADLRSPLLIPEGACHRNRL